MLLELILLQYFIRAVFTFGRFSSNQIFSFASWFFDADFCLYTIKILAERWLAEISFFMFAFSMKMVYSFPLFILKRGAKFHFSAPH